MAPKLAQRKLEARLVGSGKSSSRKVYCDVQVCGTALVFACGVAVVLLFVFADIRTLYLKTATTPAVVLQKNLGADSTSQLELTRARSSTEVDVELVGAASREAADEVSEIRQKVVDSNESSKSDAEVAKVTADDAGDQSPAENVEETHIQEPRGDNAVDEVATANDDDDDASRLTKTATATQEIAPIILASQSDDDDITRESPASKKPEDPQPQSDAIIIPAGATGSRHDRASLAACDVSQGRWVYDESYPLYRTKNCPFADPGFRCEENGRPDTDFMKYRWQPHRCDLPRFNGTEMLERLRNQRMVFVGDSLGRNNWEAMLCMLAEGVRDKARVYEVNGQPITKHTGKLVFRFEDYNCTVEYYRDPFLIPQTRPPPNSPRNVTCALKVDHVSWSSGQWKDANIIILNAGHWWTVQKIFRQGCRFQKGNKLMDYDIDTAFRIALRTWGTWMENNIDPAKTQVFFLSFASVHFRGGTWNRGGHCHQEKRPLTEEEARAEWQVPWTNKVIEDEIKYNIKKKRSSINYVDITTATNYRSDGHGALYTHDIKIYGLTPRNRQDCSHFCLPGVPDAWNELIFANLLARGKGAWGQPIRF